MRTGHCSRPTHTAEIFFSVGSYNPNEFFANNWVYEGLVSYGPEGKILPALAKSWDIEDTAEGGTKYTFQLREGVTFHDGAAWDCGAAKMNFDHVLAGVLVEPVWHGWYGVPKYLTSWECTDDTTLVLTTSAKFYPFLQELSFIRPLRFLSPNGFSEGAASDPYTANSCERGWGTIESERDGVKPVVCAGIANSTGTGPFSLGSRKQSVLTTADFDELRVDDEVVFEANADYWGGAPAIETLRVVRYNGPEEIRAALLDGSLDVMWGDGVLPSNAVGEINEMDGSDLDVFIGDDIQNVVLLLNTGTPPLDDIRVRKAVIHAINKKRLIERELGGLLDPVDNVFPRSMPYCDVDLTPHWDYDLEKAMLLSCNLESGPGGAAAVVEAETDNSLAVGLDFGLGIALVIVGGIAVMYMQKSKKLEEEYVHSKNAEAA